MASMNLGRGLPPRPLLLPGAALLLAALFLLATLLVQGRALRDSAHTLAPATLAAAGGGDAPLPAATASNLGPLTNSDLFGHYDPAQAAAASTTQPPPKATLQIGDKAPDALPEASLALKLQGIVYKRDPAQRRAIIAGDGPNPEAHKIGETLLGDAVIRYIEARRVVVEQQGELKALTLVDPQLANGAPGFAAGAPTVAPMPGGAPAAYAVQPPPSPRRGVMTVEPPTQAYEPPDTPYEPPTDDSDGSAQYEEPPAYDAGDPNATDQTEPTE